MLHPTPVLATDPLPLPLAAPSASHRAGPIPLTVLTGFLGAGKTTLLNRILNGNHGLRVAVLVNDFGSINIDADLVVGVESDVISLANGCVCCSIRDDLVDAVKSVIERPERPEYVVLEASGVADPSGIGITFSDPTVRESIRVDSITCVLDAEQIFQAPAQMQLKLWQIAFADLLVLNKVDLVGAAEIAKIKAWLDEHFHRIRLIETTRCRVPLDILLASGRFDGAQLAMGSPGHAHGHEQAHEHDCHDPYCEQHHALGHAHDHAQEFSTWSYETDRPLSLEALHRVAARLPASIYRCKGVIHSADSPGQRTVLQVVGKRVDLTPESAWGERTPRTQIVAIGAHGTLDAAALRKQFDGCVVPER